VLTRCTRASALWIIFGVRCPVRRGLCAGGSPISPSRRCIGVGGGARTSETIRTTAPVSDLGLVDLVASIVERPEAWCGADRAVNVHDTTADSTNQVVVVIADSILEASRRPGGLNAADQSFGHQDGERVVHRLERDGADLGPDDLGHDVGRDVGLTGDRSQHRQPLSGDLNAAFAEEVCRVNCHAGKSRSIL
jgi:hypothetical protein